MARLDSILDTIGNTPIVRLNRLAPEGVNVYVKVESFNPTGSVKDRMARAVIERAEQTGELKPNQTVIEATSGNTGIGLAMVCAQKGYPLIVTMSENFSVERRKLLRFLGARVVLTPAAEKGTGMLKKAEELAQTHGYFLCRQFENEANADIHAATTAQEILREFQDEQLHYWVSGFGTGGTLNGVARGLKAADPAIQVVATEPDNSAILASGIPQPQDEHGTPTASHPLFRPHLMQGWSPDFISKLTEQARTLNLVDEIMPVSGKEALSLARDLARKEGIFVGISSGATLAGALEVARRSPQGTNILCMLTDTGERYLSTPLFEGISEQMSQEEMDISASTPGYQFAPVNISNSPPETAPATNSSSQIVALNAEVEKTVGNLIADNKVVMFALEWCEFCWSVRKLFAALEVEYTSVDLDSVAYQDNNLGGEIRKVLTDKLKVSTIPQIFIGGRHIGGGTDVFEAYENGTLLQQLTALKVEFNKQVTVNPAGLLPQWLHPRKSA